MAFKTPTPQNKNMDSLDKSKLFFSLSSVKLPGVHDTEISLFLSDDAEILIGFALLGVNAQLSIES